jgi:TatD DNase family protein
MLGGGALFFVSFGIHPQSIVDGLRTVLEKIVVGTSLVSRSLVAIGECGFDFYGDAPGLVRNEENERIQRSVFELQLEIAEQRGLPVVLHVRKAMDLIFAYTKRLKRLPAVIFHSWNAPLSEAEALLGRGLQAFFSFGASIINGNKKSRASCGALPLERLLLETDAPWQAPKGLPFSRLEDIDAIIAECASIRGMDALAIETAAERNFRRAYGL